jgi:hypothetical protein
MSIGNIQAGSPVAIGAGAALQVKSSQGALLGFYASVAGTADLYDGTGTGGTHFGVALVINTGWNPIPAAFASGLYIALTTAAGTAIFV